MTHTAGGNGLFYCIRGDGFRRTANIKRKGVFDKNEAIETLVRSLPLGMNKGIDGMVCVTDDVI